MRLKNVTTFYEIRTHLYELDILRFATTPFHRSCKQFGASVGQRWPSGLRRQLGAVFGRMVSRVTVFNLFGF